MLLQDVRREGKFAVPIIKEGLASLPGLKGGAINSTSGGRAPGGDRTLHGRDVRRRVGSVSGTAHPGTGLRCYGRRSVGGGRCGGETPDRRVAFVSVYRPPGSLGGVEGSLVHRYGRLYKLSEAALIHAKFYEDLSRWLGKLRADGFEAIIGGD